jgi:hypothetical protein
MFLLTNMYDVNVNQEEYHECFQETAFKDVAENDNITHLINATRSSYQVNGLPGDIRRFMSMSSKRSVNIYIMEYKVSFP